MRCSLAYERINFFRKPAITATRAVPSSTMLLGLGPNRTPPPGPPGPLVVVGPVVVVVGPVVGVSPVTKPANVKDVLNSPVVT